MGKLTAEQMDEALAEAQTTGERIGRCLLRWELIQPDVLCRALSIQTSLPMTVLDGDAMPDNLSKLFPLALMNCHFVPFDETRAVVCVAACNPLEQELLKELEKNLKKVIEVFLAREDQVARQLDWLRVKLKTRSRRTLRFARLQISYQFCDRLGVRTDKEIHEGSTLNISEGGYLLDGPQSAEDPGEMLKKGFLYINACLKLDAGEIWAICEVREIRLVDEAPKPRWLLGVEILDINTEAKRA